MRLAPQALEIVSLDSFVGELGGVYGEAGLCLLSHSFARRTLARWKARDAALVTVALAPAISDLLHARASLARRALASFSGACVRNVGAGVQGAAAP